MSVCTVERFLHDVTEHQMEIICCDGVNRHIRFRKPGTMCYHFDLITWPGVLCYTGDMGTYVFQRMEDMFEFFRTDRRDARHDEELSINLGYWSEKLIATDCNGRNGGKATEFDEDRFRQVINEYRIGWMRSMREAGTSKKQRRELWEDVDCHVLRLIDDGEQRACMAAYDYHLRVDHVDYSFDDLFEHRFDRYTFHFTWCCYALAWGIHQYDQAKEKVACPN